MERGAAEMRNRIGNLQQELDNSVAVQTDFVRLSQSLQMELEKIRQSEKEASRNLCCCLTPFPSVMIIGIIHTECAIRSVPTSKVFLKVFLALPQAGGPIRQLLCSQARNKLQQELQTKQNLKK